MPVSYQLLSVLICLVVGGLVSPARAQPNPSPVSMSFDFRNGSLGWQVGFAYWSPGDPYPPLGEIRNLPPELGVNGTGLYVQGNGYSDALIIFLKRRLGTTDGIVAGQTYQVNYTIVFASAFQTGCVGIGGGTDSITLGAGASPSEPLALAQVAPYRNFEMNVDFGPGGTGHGDGLATSVTGNATNGIPCGSAPPKWVSVNRTHQHKSLVNASSNGELWLLVDTASGWEYPTVLYYQRIDVTLTPVSPPPPPVLLTNQTTGRAATVDSVTLTKEPFSVLSAPHLNFSPDERTRIALFAYNMELKAGEDLSAITVQAEDSKHRTYMLPVEYAGVVPNFTWISQLTAKLPDELQGAGDVWVSVSLRGVASNKALVKII